MIDETVKATQNFYQKRSTVLSAFLKKPSRETGQLSLLGLGQTQFYGSSPLECFVTLGRGPRTSTKISERLK